MNVFQKIFKGAVILTAGEAVSQSCAIFRNVILARVLTKSDFGVAALLGLSMSMFEVGSRISVEQSVVQARQGHTFTYMATAHAIQSTLGILSTIALMLLAGKIAAYFGVPQATSALRLLAIVPALRGIAHLDVFRMTRDLRFSPGVLIEVAPQILITALAWPLAVILPNYIILVWLLILKQVCSTAGTHLIAQTRYHWSIDLPAAESIFVFGWPLLLNGALMFVIMQGDRLALGIRFGVSDLGVYAIAGSLALAPAAALLKLTGAALLPVLASTRDDGEHFRQTISRAAEVLGILATAYAILTIIAGGVLIPFIFGERYIDAIEVLAWLGCAQALRILRGLPTTGAMAKGDTKNLLFSSVVRSSGALIAFLVAFCGGSLPMIAACSAGGEAIALLASFVRFHRAYHIQSSSYLPAFTVSLTFIVLSAAAGACGISRATPWIPMSTVAVFITAAFSTHLAMFTHTRHVILGKSLSLIAFTPRIRRCLNVPS